MSPIAIFLAYLSLCTITNGVLPELILADPRTNSLVDEPHHRVLPVRRDPLAHCIYGIYELACWQDLDLTHWLSNWYNVTPACTTEQNTDNANCRAAGETWTDSFLRIAQNITGGPSCVDLYACQGDPPNSEQVTQGFSAIETARYRYVCYNIYAINFFFSNWYTAMHYATLDAGNLVADIVEVIDPPTKQSNVFLDDLLAALSAGLAFLAIPEAAALGGAAAAIAPIFLKAIQQAPAVARIIWPIGSVQREIIEIGDLQNQLETVVAALEPRIAQALATVMGKNQTDISAFLAFAKEGDFSRPRDQFPDIVNDTSGLLVGFTTFLVSEALVLDDWHAVASIDTDPFGLSNKSASCPFWLQNFATGDPNPYEYDPANCPGINFTHFNYYDLDCYAYDEYSQCNNSYWWYSRDSRTAFTLAKDPYYGNFESASKAEKDPTSILHTIFTNRWSTGQLLLENAGLCIVELMLYEIFGNTTGQSLPYWKYSLEAYDTNVFSEYIFKSNIMDGLRAGRSRLYPPNGTSYSISSDGIIDFNCTSQLNLTIYTDWPSVWYLHKKLT